MVDFVILVSLLVFFPAATGVFLQWTRAKALGEVR